MKKIVKLVIAMTITLGLIGCSGSSTSPEKVLKILEDNDYTIYFKISETSNYYTSDIKEFKASKDKNSGLVYPGESIAKPRLAQEPKEITSMEIRKGISSSFSINDKKDTLQYMFNNIVYLKNPATEKEDYIYPNQETDNKGIMEQYTKELETLGITDKELLEFFIWSKDNIQKDMLEKLKTTFNEQAPLTAADAVALFQNNDIVVDTTDNNTVYLAAPELGLFILGNTGENNQRIGFEVIDYEQFMNNRTDKTSIYMDLLDSSNETAMTYDMSALYDLNNNKVIAGSEAEIKTLLEDCNNLKTKFLEMLSSCQISLTEFKNFIKTY